jgi:hypothetical protein
LRQSRATSCQQFALFSKYKMRQITTCWQSYYISISEIPQQTTKECAISISVTHWALLVIISEMLVEKVNVGVTEIE